MGRQTSNVTTVRNDGCGRAAIFVHGYSGARDDTWDLFPALLRDATNDLDIFSIGYTTSWLPDLVGVWSADPDLPLLAIELSTMLGIGKFERYRSLSLIAHSMGGLVVQKALVDDAKLAARMQHVILFGTPSAGLRKARWFRLWKRQFKNMAFDSRFIEILRADWTRLFGDRPPFNLLAVAGTSDQFVPRESSLDPFDASLHRAVSGDHLSIVKPADAAAPSIALVVATLMTGRTPALDKASEVRLASEIPTSNAAALVKALEEAPGAMSPREIVDAALALDRAGEREASIALLEKHKDQDTDVKGSLGGRYKRLWFETEERRWAERALTMYSEGLAAATAAHVSEQIYYQAINVAFMKLTFLGDREGAQSAAALAMVHASPPGDDPWRTATVAEAHLYFGRTEQALTEYKRLAQLDVAEWKLKSAGHQAIRIAARLGNEKLMEELDSIFTTADMLRT